MGIVTGDAASDGDLKQGGVPGVRNRPRHAAGVWCQLCFVPPLLMRAWLARCGVEQPVTILGPGRFPEPLRDPGDLLIDRRPPLRGLVPLAVTDTDEPELPAVQGEGLHRPVSHLDLVGHDAVVAEPLP